MGHICLCLPAYSFHSPPASPRSLWCKGSSLGRLPPGSRQEGLPSSPPLIPFLLFRPWRGGYCYSTHSSSCPLRTGPCPQSLGMAHSHTGLVNHLRWKFQFSAYSSDVYLWFTSAVSLLRKRGGAGVVCSFRNCTTPPPNLHRTDFEAEKPTTLQPVGSAAPRPRPSGWARPPLRSSPQVPAMASLAFGEDRARRPHPSPSRCVP